MKKRTRKLAVVALGLASLGYSVAAHATPVQVPAPATLGLLGLGIALFAVAATRRKK
jgi:hypothetical protein